MATTTVLTEDSATTITQEAEPRRFAWSAVFAGALVAVAVSLLLITLGSGVGLSLVSARHATTNGAITFLTLGAIYFLAAQAFGFAAGGHVVGRLIGPAIETRREEDFRAGVHGLVAWALAAVATVVIVAVSALVIGSATANGAANGAVATTAANGTRGDAQPAQTAYWVDKLFRPAVATQAALPWRRYAQADTGTATDATPAPSEPSAITPGDNEASPASEPAPNAQPVFLNNANTASPNAPATTPIGPALPHSLGSDKAEAGRILTAGMADGESLAADDHAQLARLVAQDTGLTYDAAQRRVDDVTAKMREAVVKAADTARKIAATASLWTAFALLFGAIVAMFAAVSARWEDDREAGLMPGTRVVETRF